LNAASLERHGAIGVVTIDNPPVNALGHAVRAAIVACMESADRDPDIDVIVITGEGRLFSAGADIREFGRPAEPPPLPEVVHRVEASEKPVIAAIRGSALGGGLELALGCHYRVGARDASVGLPEVSLGLLPGATGTQRLPRLAGVAAALDIMLGGRPLTADKALEAGLLDAIIDDEEFEAGVLRYAEARRGEGPRRLRDASVPAAEAGVFDATRKAMAARTRGLLSPEKIIQCVEAATRLDYEAGCTFERAAFEECKASAQSDGLRHAFFAEKEAGKVAGIDRSTDTRTVESLAVIGAGTMGAGIAYAALAAGLRVHLVDSDRNGLERGLKIVGGYVDYALNKGKLDAAAADELRQRLGSGTELDAVADVDLVIEAVFESMSVKLDVFTALDRHCRDGAVLATNTSTLDVDRIARATDRPQDVIGLHFFSPAHLMRLLEIVRGERTASDVVATALALARRLGKIGVVVGNCFGFVGNRMLYGYGRENQFMLLEGAAPEYIDEVLVNWGMAMGPNAVGDLAGLDVGYKVRRERDDLPDDPRFYRVADLLVEKGRYGQKTGRGMFLYDDGARQPRPDAQVAAMIRDEAERLGIVRREISAEEIVERCIYALVVEGARLLEEGIVERASDIDVVWINGYGFPRHRGGPMHVADRKGLRVIVDRCRDFAARFGKEYWTPPALLADLAEQGGSFGGWRRPRDP